MRAFYRGLGEGPAATPAMKTFAESAVTLNACNQASWMIDDCCGPMLCRTHGHADYPECPWERVGTLQMIRIVSRIALTSPLLFITLGVRFLVPLRMITRTGLVRAILNTLVHCDNIIWSGLALDTTPAGRSMIAAQMGTRITQVSAGQHYSFEITWSGMGQETVKKPRRPKESGRGQIITLHLGRRMSSTAGQMLPFLVCVPKTCGYALGQAQLPDDSLFYLLHCNPPALIFFQAPRPSEYEARPRPFVSSANRTPDTNWTVLSTDVPEFFLKTNATLLKYEADPHERVPIIHRRIGVTKTLSPNSSSSSNIRVSWTPVRKLLAHSWMWHVRLTPLHDKQRDRTTCVEGLYLSRLVAQMISPVTFMLCSGFQNA